MSEISDMIQRLCPYGVEYRKLGAVVNFLSLSARRRGPCKKLSHSMHIFIKKAVPDPMSLK